MAQTIPRERMQKKSFIAEVRRLIKDCGYEFAYEYCKCKYNNCVYNGKAEKAEIYKNQIEKFRELGMKEYRIRYENGTPSTHYSMIIYNKGDIIGFTVDGDKHYMAIIERII